MPHRFSKKTLQNINMIAQVIFFSCFRCCLWHRLNRGDCFTLYIFSVFVFGRRQLWIYARAPPCPWLLHVWIFKEKMCGHGRMLHTRPWPQYMSMRWWRAEVGKMTTFDLWPIPLGGGAWGAGTNMWHPETPASYESLPAPLATQIPTLWILTSGGRGCGGALILDRCRAFDLFVSVDAHLWWREMGSRGGQNDNRLPSTPI